MGDFKELQAEISAAIPFIVQSHFASVSDRKEEYAIFISSHRNTLTTNLGILLNSLTQTTFADLAGYQKNLEEAQKSGYADGKTTAEILGRNIPFVLELSKDLNLTIQHFMTGLIEKHVHEANLRVKLLDRMMEYTWSYFVGFASGYIAVKDQQIDHLHGQKVSLMGQMAAGMAHEIRNPLASIKGFAQLVKHRLNDPLMNPADLALYLDLCIHEIDTLNAIVTDFLLLAHKKEFFKNHHEPIDVKHTLHRVSSMVGQTVLSEDIRLDLVLPDYNLYVNGITTQLEQVFLNLMKNSIDAVTDPGVLLITAELMDEQVVIHFTDNGSGIPEDMLERIFDPFFTTKDKGTGIGLSICKQIIEQHGGCIHIESAQGQGTTIRLRLPSSSGHEQDQTR